MAIVDYNAIINGTPQKVLLNGFNHMKENYTEESAQEYFSLYNNQPLSFIIENSRWIFSEPYYGLSFYKEKMEDISLCNFTVLESELEKVNLFIEENSSLMGNKQRELYNDLSESLSTLLEHTKNTRVYADYIKEAIDDTFETKLSDLVNEYSEDNDNVDSIINLFKESNSPIINMTYIPYVSSKINSGNLNSLCIDSLNSVHITNESTEDEWRTYINTTICGNRLKFDKYYRESVYSLINHNEKIVVEHFMNTSISDILNDLVTENTNSSDICHVSPVSAINSIFDDIYESEIDEEFNNEFKSKINRYKAIAYESTLDILIRDYQMSNDTNLLAEGYTILNESCTLDEAFDKINSLLTESTEYIIESSDDEDLDDLEEDEDEGGNTGKKPSAPKPKNLANKIQFSAMDKESKHNRKKAEREQKGQEIVNAAKAVTQLPLNVLKDIKRTAHKFDEMDDERRKNFMTEPGFRKKIFRNLKLAIMYGTAGNIKLSYIPVVAVCRHFSKQKDVRIRNELSRELMTEIKVCEEKINDASFDKQEKYRLMRIRDQLAAELTRVKLNSKYV